jgi:hypothetical protein
VFVADAIDRDQQVKRDTPRSLLTEANDVIREKAIGREVKKEWLQVRLRQVGNLWISV